MTVSDLIANKGTKFEESDRPWLDALGAEQLAKMAPAEVEKPPENLSTNAKDCECAQKIDTLLSNSDRDALNYGKQALAQRRTELTTHITGNSNGSYVDGDLDGMTIDALEKLGSAMKAPVADYSLRRAPTGNVGDTPLKMPEPMKEVSVNWAENKTVTN